jgi:hypothetical protein
MAIYALCTAMRPKKHIAKAANNNKQERRALLFQWAYSARNGRLNGQIANPTPNGQSPLGAAVANVLGSRAPKGEKKGDVPTYFFDVV